MGWEGMRVVNLEPVRDMTASCCQIELQMLSKSDESKGTAPCCTHANTECVLWGEERRQWGRGSGNSGQETQGGKWQATRCKIPT